MSYNHIQFCHFLSQQTRFKSEKLLFYFDISDLDFGSHPDLLHFHQPLSPICISCSQFIYACYKGPTMLVGLVKFQHLQSLLLLCFIGISIVAGTLKGRYFRLHNMNFYLSICLLIVKLVILISLMICCP
jgi:hypothetical protein